MEVTPTKGLGTSTRPDVVTVRKHVQKIIFNTVCQYIEYLPLNNSLTKPLWTRQSSDTQEVSKTETLNK